MVVVQHDPSALVRAAGVVGLAALGTAHLRLLLVALSDPAEEVWWCSRPACQLACRGFWRASHAFLRRRSHSIRFTRAQGTPKYKICVRRAPCRGWG